MQVSSTARSPSLRECPEALTGLFVCPVPKSLWYAIDGWWLAMVHGGWWGWVVTEPLDEWPYPEIRENRFRYKFRTHLPATMVLPLAMNQYGRVPTKDSAVLHSVHYTRMVADSCSCFQCASLTANMFPFHQIEQTKQHLNVKTCDLFAGDGSTGQRAAALTAQSCAGQRGGAFLIFQMVIFKSNIVLIVDLLW